VVSDFVEAGIAALRHAQERDRPGKGHVLDLRPATLQRDQRHAVMVAKLGRRQRHQRTRIADGLASNGLRLVQVAERDVGSVRREHARRHGMLPANQDAPFRPLAFGGACNVKVAGDDERAVLGNVVGLGVELGVERGGRSRDG